ncbi:MAG: cupin domain-containing protein [Lactobacillus sp.]|nr:MAG: cupin domain-containing protein [Lactobacillus sp.]
MTASGTDRNAAAPTRDEAAAQLSSYAQDLVRALDLAPHPEGGWYRRTWQSATVATGDASAAADLTEDSTSARPLASLIYFLLPAGDASAWHVVDADELWLWHGPGPITLELAGTGDAPDLEHATRYTLYLPGPTGEKNAPSRQDPTRDARTQLVVPAGVWQRTVPTTEDALASCVVSPGFVYSGFSLAK